MRVLYFDAFSGVSGDMTVGALLALGLSLDQLRAELQHLPLSEYSIDAESVSVNGIGAVKFSVRPQPRSDHPPHEHHPHRPFRSVRALLAESRLSTEVKERALAVFTALARAEGSVHGIAPDDVEFHEVGAVDAIVDVVATAVGFTALGIEAAYVSPLPLGSGLMRSQHGTLPVPAPATVELLQGYPVRVQDGEGELVTPTGAAIVAALTRPEPPPLRIDAVGYGAGSRRLADRPNVLRLVLGAPATAVGTDEMVLLATNIDDANPEIYGYVMERLLDAGARDVYLTPVYMKKNRPGIVLNVLCSESDRARLTGIVLSETTAIGVRYHTVQRSTLARESVTVDTELGAVLVKVAHGPEGCDNVAPEYEDCCRIARERSVPLKTVYQAALAAYWRR